MTDPTSTAAVADFILKSVIGGAIIAILTYFISQILKGVWVAKWQYDVMLTQKDAVVAMKDAIIAEQKIKIEHLEAKLEKVEVTLRESASTMNQVIGAAVSKGGAHG